MASRYREFPMTSKKVPVTKSRVAGFLDWGPGNLYPQTLLDVIYESDTASAAMSVRAEFIEGNGLTDLALSEMVVNRKGQTLDDIHVATSHNVANGEVVCLHVAYNGLAQIVGIQSVPFEWIRFKEADDLGNVTMAGIFPYLGSVLYRKKQAEHKEVYLFDPRPDVVYAQIAASGGIEHYHGQLFYTVAGVSTSEQYHTPSYAGGAVAFETEKELATYRYRLVTSDLITPGFIKGLKSKQGNKENQEDGDSLTNRVAAHQGAENAGAVFVIEADTVEELAAISFESMAGNDLAQRYKTMAEEVAESISRRMRVPNELMGVRKSTGGISFTSIQINLFSQLMQQTVNRYQRTISRAYAQIFAHWHVPLGDRDFGIENLNYFPKNAQTPTDDGTVAQPG